MALRDALLRAESDRAAEIAAVHQMHRRSAANLVHYVELRRHDIRDLQHELTMLGLSSLGRSEPYVLATIEAVLRALAALSGQPGPEPSAAVGLSEGDQLLTQNTDELLGPPPHDRSTRIMVNHAE